MADQKFFRGFFRAVLAAGVLAACAGTGTSTANTGPSISGKSVSAASRKPVSAAVEEALNFVPQLRFIPAAFPVPAIDPDAGLITEERQPPGAGEEYVAQTFRSAYAEAFFRDEPLAGVLGGDRVHPWPMQNPVCRVQNWRGSVNYPNSWGIPSLILALEHPVLNRVFTVSGIFLDCYGKSAGINGANGAAGYGCPRGNPFFYQGGAAQRFDLGLMAVDSQGELVFTPGDAPSSGVEPPPLVGSYEGGDWVLRNRISGAFRTAWILGVDRNLPSLDPDGPVSYIDCTQAPWSAGPPYTVTGFYVQTFAQASAALVLAEGADPLSRVRLLLPPFLEGLTALPDAFIQGSESLSQDRIAPVPEIDDPFLKALAEGMAFYGVPLTDPMPYKDGSQEAQRFSGGWVVRLLD